MRVTLVTTGLLVLMCISGMNAACRCVPQDYYLHFPKRGITDYVVLGNAVANDLSEFSLCLFFRPDPAEPDTAKYIPVSYAAGEMNGNDLQLKTSPSIQMMLVGQKVDTQFRATPGYWHQMYFSWRSSDGSWELYVNGKLEGWGRDFGKGLTIRAGGTLVLAQEQDVPGGGFSATEAYLGGLSEVNLWDRVLTRSEVEKQMSNCRFDDGSAMSWSDLRNRGQNKGGVLVVRS